MSHTGKDSAGSESKQESARRKLDLLRTVIDTLPDSIFAKDHEGRFMLANEAFARIMNAASPAGVVGKTDLDLLPTQPAKYYQGIDHRVLENGESLINLEEPYVDADGQRRWNLTTKVPVRGEDGQIHGLVAISRDITAQKIAEEALQAANEELSRGREQLLDAMARLRTAHEELRTVQAQLIEVEKLKSIGRLAAGVAHEIKNPLAIATAGLDYLAQETFPKESSVPTIIEEMRRALHRADLIVRGLLDFSAPEEISPARQDLNGIVEKSLAPFRSELAHLGITVEKDLQPNLPPLSLDQDKIEQALVNLIGNAIHAMNGPGKLTVRTHAEVLAGVGPNIGDTRSESFQVGDHIVSLTIDDTGPGIPRDQLSKIFEPFFTTKPTGQGTGLGLSVTKTIIDLHRGTIQIANRSEGGVHVALTFKA